MSEKEPLLPTKCIFLQLMLLLKNATALYHQTICAMKSHTAHFEHSETLEKQ